MVENNLTLINEEVENIQRSIQNLDHKTRQPRQSTSADLIMTPSLNSKKETKMSPQGGRDLVREAPTEQNPFAMDNRTMNI